MPQRLDELGQVHGRGLPLHRGTGGHDDLLDRVIQAGQQFLDAELLGADPIHGRDQPVEHMVQPVVLVGALDGLDVTGDSPPRR